MFSNTSKLILSVVLFFSFSFSGALRDVSSGEAIESAEVKMQQEYDAKLEAKKKNILILWV